MKFFLPRVCIGNEEAMVRSTETETHIHESQSEGAHSCCLDPGVVLVPALQRFANLAITENCGEIRMRYEHFNLLFLHFFLEH